MENTNEIPVTIETAFDNITKHISGEYIDVFALIGDNHYDDYDKIHQQISHIKIMTFYLLAEHKQSEKLTELIGSAINSYINSSASKISSDKPNEEIGIDLDGIYLDFKKIYDTFCDKINNSDKLELVKSIKEKFKIKYNDKKNDNDKDNDNDNDNDNGNDNDKNKDNNNIKNQIIFILNMLYKFTANENRKLFLTYIPSIIYTFHANYTKEINNCIKSLKKRTAKKDQISKAISSLTILPSDISKYSTRDYFRIHTNTIKSFLFVSLYNAIITNYRKNFIVNFLWFERNVGFYQYYLTEAEYSKVINYISEIKPTNALHKIDISIPTALYLRFKNSTFDENLWKTFDLVLTVNNASCNEEIYNFMSEIFINTSDDFDIDYNSVIGYFSKETICKVCPLQHRFMTYSVQALYYRDLLCKENFIKNNMYFYSFHCDKISDDNFKLEDVTFDLWYTSDDFADMFSNIINADDKYYIVSSMLKKDCPMEGHLILNDSIISVKKAKKIWLNGNLIDKTTSALLKLENVNFYNLTIQKIDDDKIIDFFTSKDIVESFNKLYNTEKDKIHMFLGLHYFTNIEDYPQGKKNIIALYVNGLMGYQNFFPIRGISDYSKMQIIINKYFSTLRISGSSTTFGCSASCGNSSVSCKSNNISANCSNIHNVSAKRSIQGNAQINCYGLCSKNESNPNDEE